MKQGNKELLLKDLSARLSYGVKFPTIERSETVLFIDTSDNEVWINGTNINDVKPYLFPFSSLTEEQKKEYCQLQDRVIYNSRAPINKDVMEYVNWCYKNHVDVNNLIPMGLAIDATGLSIY